MKGYKRVRRVYLAICGSCLGTGHKCLVCAGTGEVERVINELVPIEDEVSEC